MTFTLEQADSTAFARWWVVYRNANEDFSQSFTEQYRDIVDVPYCHWIMADGQRVGGVIMVGDNLGDLFLIPPFTDAEAVLQAILKDDGPHHAQNILSEHVPALQKFGFRVEESRCWMLRPTQHYPDGTFDLRRDVPQSDQTQTIAELMHAAFAGGVGQYGQRDAVWFSRSVQNYFETIQPGDICHQASSVLFDGDRMVAACLVQPYNAFASIRYVMTHPDYQRRGIARRLMTHSISTVHAEYDYVALAVTIGNSAQRLYQTMGFVAGPVIHTLAR